MPKGRLSLGARISSTFSLHSIVPMGTAKLAQVVAADKRSLIAAARTVAQLAKIDEPRLRETFLNNVPANRALCKLFVVD